jgi:CheY-like chemotaxis protein
MNRQGRVLVVDDLQEWREQITRMLQRGGYLIDVVSTPEEALERLNTTLYHALILDIRMDENNLDNVDGIEFLRQLHQLKFTEAIKVIMLSAYGTAEQMRQAFREYGVADFLSKSQVNKRTILETMQQVFEKDANINLALEIIWQQSEPKQAVLKLKIGETASDVTVDYKCRWLKNWRICFVVCSKMRRAS